MLYLDQGGGSFGDTHCPELAEPALVIRPDRGAGGNAMADPHQEGPAISGERLGMAPEPGVVEPSCMAASGISEELSTLHSRVLNTAPLGGTGSRYETFVCSEMGSVCEMVR